MSEQAPVLTEHALLAIAVVRLSAAIQLAAIGAGIFVRQAHREPDVDGLVALVEDLGKQALI